MNKSLDNLISEEGSLVNKNIKMISFKSMLDIYNKSLDPRMNPMYFPCADPINSCYLK